MRVVPTMSEALGKDGAKADKGEALTPRDKDCAGSCSNQTSLHMDVNSDENPLVACASRTHLNEDGLGAHQLNHACEERGQLQPCPGEGRREPHLHKMPK